MSIYLSFSYFIAEGSYSQKLIVEHERFKDLQCEYERMQQDYEEQLRVAAENSSRALEEQRQQYEAKLQEKSQLLNQVWSTSTRRSVVVLLLSGLCPEISLTITLSCQSIQN